MKKIIQNAAVLLLLAVLNSQFSTAHAQGTAFTYQGQLHNNGSPANGIYAVSFTLFNTNATGVPVAGPVTNNGVIVSNGLFTVPVDFGAGAFTGQSNWLEIAVATNLTGSFTTLAPRQPVTPTPYAIYSANAGNAINAASAASATAATTANTANNFSGALTGDVIGTQAATVVSSVGGQTATSVANGVSAANNATSVNTANTIVQRDSSGNISAGTVAANAFSGNGGGLTNLNVSASQLTSIGNTNGGLYNFFVGPSGNATTSGFYNTAIGYDAFFYNAGGSYNTADGFASLENNTNGNANTANGYGALNRNTNGSYNTANGYAALYLNASGSNNIALGYLAGYNITTGSSNIDIGNQGFSTDANIIRIGSGQSQTFIAGNLNGNGGGLTNLNVSASQLSSIGNTNGGIGNFFAGPSGNAATSGSDNTAIGNEALNANTTGSGNTANGFGALFFNSIGSGNTAEGYEALINNHTGSNNIAVGYLAGFNLNAGSSNIDIGNQGLVTDTNIIRIGSGQSQTYLAGVVTATSFQSDSSGDFTAGSGNAASGLASTVGGGAYNSASGNDSTVGGGSGNIAYGDHSTVGGGLQNQASGGGGYYTVGGGDQNQASGLGISTVGGGFKNQATNIYATVAGGANNSAGGYSSTVGGGYTNTASGQDATVGGGEYNIASGTDSTVPGGDFNIASGEFSFAAGVTAQALHQGAFVWADSQFAPFSSTTNDQFLIRARGGVGIGTGSPEEALSVVGGMNVDAGNANNGPVGSGGFNQGGPTNGCLTFGTSSTGTGFSGEGIQSKRTSGGTQYDLEFFTGFNKQMVILNNGNVGIGSATPGALLQVGSATCNGTTWASGSDRNSKEDFVAIKPAEVLAKVADLPITEWKYKVEANGTEHLGPMAQDFHAAFGLNGADDKHITMVDEGGVALAAIQGLNQKVEGRSQKAENQIEELKAENAELKEQNDSLATRLNELEATVKQLAATK
jgi:hypothetical protein